MIKHAQKFWKEEFLENRILTASLNREAGKNYTSSRIWIIRKRRVFVIFQHRLIEISGGGFLILSVACYDWGYHADRRRNHRTEICREVTAIASRKLLQKFCDIRSPQGTLRQILVAQGLLSRLNHHVISISYSAHLAFHDL